MKSVLLTLSIVFCALQVFAQKNIDISEIQKKKVDGIELMFFKEKAFSGFVTEHYADGKPKLWMSVKDGLAEGKWLEWYENGNLKFSANWKAGKGHGLWNYFHSNGKIRQEEFYNMDIPTGIFKDFYDNGQVKAQSQWLNGKKEGIWTYYSENGVTTKTEEYQDGKLIPKKDK